MALFLEAKEAQVRRGDLSRKTVREYRYPLEQVFLPYCHRVGIGELSQLDRQALDRFTDQLLTDGAKSGKPLSRPTINSYLRSVNVALNWARSEHQMDGLRPTKLLRDDRPLLDTLSREEIQRIENAAELERDKLIVRLLADTGIRVGELVALRVSDLEEQSEHQYLKVRGKTLERKVPIPHLYRRLRRYIQETRPKRVATDRMFLTRRRRPGSDLAPLTESGVQQIIRELGEAAEVGRRVHPHLFRHSFITWQLRRGTTPMILKGMVGHKTITMIDKVYSHLSPTDAYDAMVKSLAAEEQN